MRKANQTIKALILFTIVFILIAAFSFAAFREDERTCSEMEKCCRVETPSKGGEMLWDSFSRRFMSFVSIP